jgi:2,3-dihydroxybenzoate-AMP ligase
MINRGGQNIYPHEIEGMLFTHPKVKHVAIVPMPDPVMGEKACAFVVPKDGENFTFEEMTEFLLNHKIAKYKLPERLEIRKSLPLRGEHKVLKKELINEIKEILKKETENQGETN